MYDIFRKWKTHDAILQKLDRYGELIFVDATNGSDAATGEKPEQPLASLAEAIDRAVNSGNDVIVHKGYEDVGEGGAITVNKEKLSIVGWGLYGSNPFYPEIGSIAKTFAEDAPVLTIEADFVEIAGLAFASEWETDDVAYQSALRINNKNKTYIHHCYFPDWSIASQTCGIDLDGAHFSVIEDCTFHSVYGNMDIGLYISSAPGQPCYTQLRRLTFMGGSGPMAAAFGQMPGLATWQYWTAEYIKCLNVTNAVLLGGVADLYGSVKGLVGTMAKGEIFESSEADDDTIAQVTASWKVTAADCWGSDGPLTA